jgi:hypothetical protein
MQWSELIGKKVVAFRGYKQEKFGKERVTLSFILFDDEETILELREQDPYDYHDCCNSARMLHLNKDAELWKEMFGKEGFEETTEVGYDPF